jgi:hypothetical protein
VKKVTPDSRERMHAPVVKVGPSLVTRGRAQAAILDAVKHAVRKKRGKLGDGRALARMLATVEAHHAAGREPPWPFRDSALLPVPVELVALIADALIDKRPGLQEESEKAQRTHAQWQAQAEAIWQAEPDLDKIAVAKLIDPKRWNTVRRRIRKKILS